MPLAAVAAHFRCTDTTASAGLRRLGLCIDPKSVSERRRAKLAQIGADPVAIARRIESRRLTITQPAERKRIAQRSREQWRDPDTRARMVAALKDAYHAGHGARLSEASKRALARKFAWLPADRREEYEQLRRKLSAPEAKRIILEDILAKERAANQRPRLSHEQRLKRAAAGAQIIELPIIVKPAPAFTLGGIATGAL